MNIMTDDDYKILYAADTLVAAEKIKRDEELMEKVEKELKNRSSVLKSAMAEKYPESKEKAAKKPAKTIPKKEAKKASKSTPKPSKKSK